jgi:hypothetical protein
VTGDAPQPGETPRTEGNPWSFDPDAAWWRGDGDRERAEALAETAARPRHPRRRPLRGAVTEGGAGPSSAVEPDDTPGFAPEAFDAHAAGVQDTVTVFTPPVPDTPADPAEEPPAPVERDHDQPVAERYEPEPRDLAHRPEGVPEIMVLPEPDRDRPTVSLPGQSGLARRGRMSPAELDIKLSRLEHSPFWLNEDERAAATNAWPTPATRSKLADSPPEFEEGRGRPPRRKPRAPKNAAPGVFGLIALALIASFFSWVSAEPFWLAVGHGTPGVATVARCTGSGITLRCAGSFAADDGSFSKQTVALLGVEPGSRNPGAVARARVVSVKSTQAYVGTTGPLVQLRWMLGFVLVLLCGLGIAGLTGTRQLETVRARRVALLMSVAGPVLLLAGFLFAAY